MLFFFPLAYKAKYALQMSPSESQGITGLLLFYNLSSFGQAIYLSSLLPDNGKHI